MSLIRVMDVQRRLTIPKETLLAINANPGDYIKIYASQTPAGNPCIVCEKYDAGCALCQGTTHQGHKIVNGRKVCTSCVKILT